MIVRIGLALMLTISLAVSSASAADLYVEPVKKERNLFGRCSTFNQIWIFGDPTECPGDETVPECSAKSVVSAALRFANRADPAYRVARVSTLVPVREVAETVYNPSPLARRYCLASVALDNGEQATAYYFIEEDSGFVGISWSVYVCISGHDEWRVYDGRCRVAQPATVN